MSRAAAWRAAAAGYRREPRLRFNDVLLEGAAAAADAVADDLERAAAASSTLGHVPTHRGEHPMTATKRRPARRRRPTRKPVNVRVTIPAPMTSRKDLELLRDTLRMTLAARMNGATVEHRGSGTSARVVIELRYNGVALNAGALTAAAWALETIDQAVPDESPLGDVIAELGIRITTESEGTQ